MKDKLSPAVDALLGQLQELEQEAADIRRMVNKLRRRMNEEPLFSEEELNPNPASANPSRPDLYYGRPLSTVAQEYLERRGQACPAEEIVRGLEQGGFDFRALGWKDTDRIRVLSISLAKNSKAFHKLPNNTFGLLSWYPEVANRRSAPRGEKEGVPQEGATEENGIPAEEGT